MMRILSAGLLVLSLTACGGGLPAKERVAAHSGSQAFLDRVAKACGDKSIGSTQLDYKINHSGDAYFLSVTSKLHLGKITRKEYADDMNGLYPVGSNQAALDCIFSQL